MCGRCGAQSTATPAGARAACRATGDPGGRDATPPSAAPTPSGSPPGTRPRSGSRRRAARAGSTQRRAYSFRKLSRYSTSFLEPMKSGTRWCTFSGITSSTRPRPVEPTPPAWRMTLLASGPVSALLHLALLQALLACGAHAARLARESVWRQCLSPPCFTLHCFRPCFARGAHAARLARASPPCFLLRYFRPCKHICLSSCWYLGELKSQQGSYICTCGGAMML